MSSKRLPGEGLRLLLLILALGLLVACGGQTPTAAPEMQPPPSETEVEVPEEEEDTEQPSEGPFTLIVAAIRTPEGFDQEQVASLEAAEIQSNLLDTLVTYGTTEVSPGVWAVDPTSIEPRLAESWEFSDDGRTLTFKLREGVLSHAGNELTAEDVRWTYERGLALQRTSSFFLNTLLGIESADAIQVVDDYTVSITIPEPNSLFLQLFTGDGLAIRDSVAGKENITDDDPWANEFFAQNPAGFGPYDVESLEPGSQIVLVARPDYWAGEPGVSRVVYREVPQSANRLALLLSGNVHLAEYLLPREINGIPEGLGVKVVEVPGNFVYRIEFNEAMEPFDDPLVRQALNYLAPREEIIEGVFFGNARPAHSHIPSTYPGFSDSAWEFDRDVERARDLLAQAGYEDGLEISLQYDGGVDLQEQMAVLVQTAFAEADVDVTLEKIPSSAYASNTFERTMSFYFRIDSPWQADPVYASSLWLFSEAFTNYSNYSNPDADALIEQMQRELDQERRLELATELQAELMEDPPWVFLVEPDVQVPMSECLTGYTWYLTSLIRFDDFDPSACQG